MNKFLKTIMCTFLLFTSSISAISANPVTVKKSSDENAVSDYSTYAWPGRLGGNGDGSEEWLQGEYGETNGPWVEIAEYEGDVNDLNSDKGKADTIGLFLLDVISAGASLECKFAAATLTAVDIGSSFTGGYEGAYYTSVSYISGRCMKTIIKTYKDENHTKFVKSYTTYTKW